MPRIGFVSNVIINEEKLYYRSVKLATIQKLGLGKIIEIYKANIDTALSILRYCSNNGIEFYRMGNLFPFNTHPILSGFDYLLHFKDDLCDLGEFISVNDIRISFHASHYCVLNSLNKDIINKSILELHKTSKLMNELNLPENNKIVIHTGSSEGGFDASKERFIKTYERLPTYIKSRIALENDDEYFSFYKVNEIHKKTGIPLIIDIFHHRILNPENLDESASLEAAINTWENKNPEIHFSCQSLTKTTAGSHSETIDVEDLLNFIDKNNKLNYDIMLEVKDMNTSAEQIISLLRK